MKRFVVTTVGVLVFASALPVLAGESNAARAPQAMLQQGGKWSTDAPLREGMEGIRTGVAELRAKDRFSIADYRRLGDTVDARVAAIVRDCKLAPEADASLHAVIAELSAAAGEMRAPWPQPARGLNRAKEALDNYQRNFEHPGFTPVG